MSLKEAKACLAEKKKINVFIQVLSNPDKERQKEQHITLLLAFVDWRVDPLRGVSFGAGSIAATIIRVRTETV